MNRVEMSAGRALRIAYLATIALGVAEWAHLAILVFDLDPTSMDIGGHIASASSFELHAYDDTFFLGGIRNLFYPPLEDAIVAGIRWIASDAFTAYRLYVALVILAYFAAAYRLAATFTGLPARIAFLLATLFVFNAEKPGLTYYQGLGAVDLLATGLSSETLGGVFLLLLVAELWGRRRPVAIAILTALVAVSHLVILAAVLVLAAAFVAYDRKITGSMVLGLALASFTLVPMLVYREHMARSTIDLLEPSALLAIAVLGVATMIHDARVAPILLASALLFLAVLSSNEHLAWLPRPSFHYYRLASVALVLLLAGVAAIIDHAPDLRWRIRGVVYGVATAVILFVTFDLAVPAVEPRPIATEGRFGPERTWIIEHGRAGGSGIGSALSVLHPGFRSTVGLYWESARDHTLLNSYLATVLYPPVVMGYVHYRAYACEVRRCLFDQVVRDYDVRRVALPDEPPVYLTLEEHACLHGMTTGGVTRDVRLARTGTITAGGRRYGVYDVLGTHAPAEIVPVDRVRAIGATPDRPEHQVALERAFEACSAGRRMTGVFLHDGEHARFRSAAKTVTGTIAFAEVDGAYAITVDAEAPAPFRVKRTFMPGLHLVGASGEELPLFDGYPHMVGVGRGAMRLEYRRPAGMWIGYGLSLAAMAYLAARMRKRS